MDESQQYNSVVQNDLDSTIDDLDDRSRRQAQSDEIAKSNLFRTRIIQGEINSSLLFQITLYFNFYYSLLCFVLQISSVSYKLYIYNYDKFPVVRTILVSLGIFIEQARIYYGYKANIQESVYKIY